MKPQGMPAGKAADARPIDKVYDAAYEKEFDEYDPRATHLNRQIASHKKALDAVMHHVLDTLAIAATPRMPDVTLGNLEAKRIKENARKAESKRYQPFVKFVKNFCAKETDGKPMYTIVTSQLEGEEILKAFSKRNK